VVTPAVLENGSWSGEIRFRHFKTGQAIPVIYNCFRIDDPGMGEATNFGAVARDITERKRLEHELERERDRLRLLLDLNNRVVSNLNLRELLRAIAANVRRVMECDAVSVTLPASENNELRVFALDFPKSKGFIKEESLLRVEKSIPGLVFTTGKPWVGNIDEITQFNPAEPSAEGLRFACFMPLISRHRVLGTLNLGRTGASAFTDEDVDFLKQVASQVTIAVENALEHQQVTESRDRLEEQTLYLREEIRTEHNFEEIIGESHVLKRVLSQVETVAPTDSTVLILGETGTGKELIARAIHALSSRRDKTFVKVNCAAIPLGLLESELFGHEKGSFTGAVTRRIGRFELAHQGTLFLDEIGDIPLELQPKLLRVLQEQEFERLGSSQTIRTNVRLVAATSRDLRRMVAESRFRDDLYYRLNIFPIAVPPLRDRPEDIPLLVRHFVAKYGQRMKKRIDSVSKETMESMTRYDWPGNIRELQNFIERAVILTRGAVLTAPLAELKRSSKTSTTNTLEQAERQHILKILEETRWVIGGPRGAATKLGLKRTTLLYKLAKLGISRPKA
jgi:formate hydrogenlyase transcriptional activator